MSTLPQHIGPYRVLRYLGGGGFAEVLLGQDTRPRFQGAYVALKRLRREVQGEGGDGAQAQGLHLPPIGGPKGDIYRRSLLSEGQIAQGLSNLHVVKVDGLIAHRGEPVVVMEYIDGFGLDQLLTLYSGQGIPGQWVGIFLLQLTRALRALHSPRALPRSPSLLSSVTFGLMGDGGQCLGAERGIVHQDLKPSNIRVTPKGVVKVLDLGIAAPLRTPLPRIRQGTPGYRSPEQIMGARSLTPTSDLYTLGILGFELSTGRRLFPEAICHDPEALEAARDALPETLLKAEERGELPPGLRPILATLLSKGRGGRPRSAADVEVRLRGWLGARARASRGFGAWCGEIYEGLRGDGGRGPQAGERLAPFLEASTGLGPGAVAPEDTLDGRSVLEPVVSHKAAEPPVPVVERVKRPSAPQSPWHRVLRGRSAQAMALSVGVAFALGLYLGAAWLSP